jgi:hypothetical protein
MYPPKQLRTMAQQSADSGQDNRPTTPGRKHPQEDRGSDIIHSGGALPAAGSEAEPYQHGPANVLMDLPTGDDPRSPPANSIDVGGNDSPLPLTTSTSSTFAVVRHSAPYHSPGRLDTYSSSHFTVK